MIVDSHQHFWSLSRTDYGWLTPDTGVLYRDYLPRDLAPLLRAASVRATVLVQAAPTEAETRYLFTLAQAHSFVAGVVGWVNFEAPDAERRIAALLDDGQGKLKGLRPMVQEMLDPGWLRRTALDRTFQALAEKGLVFEALVRPAHLEALRWRLMRHPDLEAVLDHAGKPDIEAGAFGTWAEDLARLARDTRAQCKLSGLLTEARRGSSFTELAPYVEHIFHCFGPDRLLWGSDWPVLNGVSHYHRWLDLALELVARFGEDREMSVMGRNAVNVYKLELPPLEGTPLRPRLEG